MHPLLAAFPSLSYFPTPELEFHRIDHLSKKWLVLEPSPICWLEESNCEGTNENVDVKGWKINMKIKTRDKKDEKKTCQVLEEMKQQNLIIDLLKQRF